VTASHTSATRLRRAFDDAVTTGGIGGANVLWKLSALANDCISGIDHSQDAVAFVLSTLFALHAEDREERVVTGDDTYLLMGSGDEYLNNAILFIEHGGTAEDAVRIITALIPIMPDTLYGHPS
jgi:hypothetical protein